MSPQIQKGGHSTIGRLIYHRETYGGHAISNTILSISTVRRAVDISAGEGRDLVLIKSPHPDAETIAVEGTSC